MDLGYREATNTPPSSLENEQAFLGLILKYQTSETVTDTQLMPNDFYYPQNKILFEAMQSLERRDFPIDFATLCNEICSLERAPDFNYEEYIGELISNATALGNLESYSKIIKEHATMRDLLNAMRAIEVDIYDRKLSATDIVDKAESLVFGLNHETQNKNNMRHITDLTVATKTQIEEKSKQPDVMEYETGFYDLDKITNGLQPGDLVIVAGRPSMGKTSLAMNIAEHIATIRDKGVIVFSMEMSSESLVTRFFSAVGKVPLQHLRTAKMKSEDWIGLTRATAELDKTDIMIDNTANLSPAEIRSKVRKAAISMKKSLGLIVVDYIQLMKGSNSAGNNRVLEISEISRSLKGLAIELDIPIIALSQLSRGVEARPNKRPVMSDLRDSGAIEQDADLILFIYRDEVYNKSTENPGIAELNIAKHRNGEIGTVYLRFFGQYTRFESVANGSQYNNTPEQENASF